MFSFIFKFTAEKFSKLVLALRVTIPAIFALKSNKIHVIPYETVQMD